MKGYILFTIVGIIWSNLAMNNMVNNSAPGLKQEGQNYISQSHAVSADTLWRETGYSVSSQEQVVNGGFGVIATRQDSWRGSNPSELGFKLSSPNVSIGDPYSIIINWIPAFAGMTKETGVNGNDTSEISNIISSISLVPEKQVEADFNSDSEKFI